MEKIEFTEEEVYLLNNALAFFIQAHLKKFFLDSPTSTKEKRDVTISYIESLQNLGKKLQKIEKS